MEKEICEEDDTPFSGGMTLSHTNDGAQMESRKKPNTGGASLIFHCCHSGEVRVNGEENASRSDVQYLASHSNSTLKCLEVPISLWHILHTNQ